MLCIENLSFEYKSHPVLHNVSFPIEKNSITCLIGPNGSGKTTLLDCLVGIHSDYTGQILIDGNDIAALKNNQRMQFMGYVPQGKNHTFPFTVKEMVIMGRAPYLSSFEQPGEADEKLALEALSDLGMADYADRIFTQLSGGEQQMVILARALTQNPEVLIFDEPMVSLDYFNELQFLEIIVRLVAHHHKSILMATHAPNHAFYFSEHGLDTKVLMLKSGTVLDYGAPKDVLTAENLKAVYSIDASIFHYDTDKQFIIPKGI